MLGFVPGILIQARATGAKPPLPPPLTGRQGRDVSHFHSLQTRRGVAADWRILKTKPYWLQAVAVPLARLDSF